jgi:Ca-activated chloride channel family protein
LAANVFAPATPGLEAPMMGTNVSFGGSQDVGFFRDQLEAGQVPTLASLDAPGFFAEHYIELPPPACGERICLQPIVAVMGNLMNGSPCTMLQLGLNSPIAADPAMRPPLDLAVVVDVSGSMQGEKLTYVKEGLGLLIDAMRDADRLALITYSSGAQVLHELGEVGLRRAELRRSVSELIAEGGTNIEAGLTLGYQSLLMDLDPEREHRVILLSDGNPTEGITDTPSILASSGGFNSEGIGLSTIGLGADFNIDLMRKLSQQADGNFYFLEDAGAVREVFEEELAFFVVPVALELELELRAGESYDFSRAYGAPLWRDTSDGGQLEIPSVFLAHRESDQDVTEDDGRRGGGSSLIVELLPKGSALDAIDAEVATVDLTFRDPSSDELVQESITLRYPGRLGSVPEAGYFEAERLSSAHKSFVMLNVFSGMENAIAAFHEDTASAETIADLDALIDAVRDYNDEIDDKDIELDLELLDMLRANLVRAGVPDGTRPPRLDPWPSD